MASEESGRKKRRPAGGRTLARAVGRVAIWTAFGLVLVRGGQSIVSPVGPAIERVAPASPTTASATAAFAVRFARSYLADPSPDAMAPFMADGVGVGTGKPPTGVSGQVAQAEISETEDLGGGEAIVTVACELRDARTLYLAVPIARSRAGEVAALGAPAMVAGPGTAAGAEAERPRPLAGPDASEIEALVSKFLPEYLSAGEADDLSYFVAAGSVIQPLRGEEVLGSINGVEQLGDGEGPRRTVLVAARVEDAGGGGTYPLAYRLELERPGSGDRWYVAALQGASA